MQKQTPAGHGGRCACFGEPAIVPMSAVKGLVRTFAHGESGE
jgi:hypothetical protein